MSFNEHVYNNISLLGLSLIFLPLDFAILCIYYIWGRLFQRKVIRQNVAKKKTVLVTSTRMTKCLTIMRALHLAGHRVIAAEIEPWGTGSANKYSRSVSKYYDLPSHDDLQAYIRELKRIVEFENVDLWIPVSGVQTTVEDCEAASELQRTTKCRTLQYNPRTCKILHEKDLFIEKTKELGLTVPDTHRFIDKEAMLEFLDQAAKDRKDAKGAQKLYILKCIGVDDVFRANVPLLPCLNSVDTQAALQNIRISKDNPWILQQYISGQEYTTHAVVTHGEVRAFGACESSELLMYYDPLPADCGLTQAMLEFTKKFARSLDPGQLNGQMSFDFMVQKPTDGRDYMDLRKEEITLYPIECNPRTHTAVVLFGDQPLELAAAHMTIFEDPKALQESRIVIPSYTVRGRYWIGHDVVTLLLFPLLDLLTMRTSIDKAAVIFKGFFEHFLFWQDGVLEAWDPLPWFMLYHVHWPFIFLKSLWTGQRWSRINVSTTRVFDAHMH